MKDTTSPLVAGFYPCARGLGVSLMTSHHQILWFESTRLNFKNTHYLKRIERYLTLYQPQIIILRDESSSTFRGSPRTTEVLQNIRRLAQDYDINAINLSREDVRKAFAPWNITTKYEIAQKIVSWFPVLQEYLPEPRKAWQAEDVRMAGFDAVALIVAYYALVL